MVLNQSKRQQRELLSGILLISGQSRLFDSNSMVWLCDQESTETFLKGVPPESRRLRRWWSFLAQLELNIYRVWGLQNELCDGLSRENFDEKISASSEFPSREAFQKMDVHLYLTTSKRNYSVLYGSLTMWRSMGIF